MLVIREHPAAAQMAEPTAGMTVAEIEAGARETARMAARQYKPKS